MVDDHEMDVEQLKEVMSVISTEIPKLLDAVNKQLSNPENARKMGEVVALFYKQMVESGMGQKEAFALTEKFMSSFSLGSMIGQVFSHGKTKDDIDEMVEERIKERIRKKLDDD